MRLPQCSSISLPERLVSVWLFRKVTFQEWNDYYEEVSMSIDLDDHFGGLALLASPF